MQNVLTSQTLIPTQILRRKNEEKVYGIHFRRAFSFHFKR